MLNWMASLVALSDEKLDNIYYIKLNFKNSLIDYNILSNNFNTKQKVLELLNFNNIIEFKKDFPFVVTSIEKKEDNVLKIDKVDDFINKFINEKYESIYLFKDYKWIFLNREEFCNLYCIDK
jgi:hypothetical protein